MEQQLMSNYRQNDEDEQATSNKRVVVFLGTKIELGFFEYLHMVLGMISLFLSFRCVGFNLMHQLTAFCCPYIYIPFALALTCYGKDLSVSV